MKTRTISGFIYTIIVVAAFLLRQFVDFRLFNVLLYVFAFFSCYELSRATEKYAIKHSRTLAIIFGAIYIPLLTGLVFVVHRFCFYAFLMLSFLFFVITLIMGIKNKDKLKAVFVSCLNYVYPGLFIVCMGLINYLNEGFIGLLLMFVISPVSDVFAYLVGMTYSKIKKGNVKKLAPKLSPNKTVAGAIGGIFGGIIAALIVYFIFGKTYNLSIIGIIILGLLGSVLTELGDLFESYIKRRCNVKDMGNIMPGHGGVLDRIDGMSFCALLIFIYFRFIV